MLNATDVEDLLLELELVDEETLEWAHDKATQNGSTVEEVLVVYAHVNEYDMAAVVAHCHGGAAVDLENFHVDRELLALAEDDYWIENSLLPMRMVEGVLFVISDRRRANTEELSEMTGAKIDLLIAENSVIDRLLQETFSSDYIANSVGTLKENNPRESAHVVLSYPQKIFFILILVAIIIGCFFSIVWTVVVLIALASFLFYAPVSFYRIKTVLLSLGFHGEDLVTPEEIAAVSDSELDIYTILIPMRDEAAIVGQIAEGINGLDYPRTKLDVKLLVDSDDESTIEAIRDLNLPPHFRLVIVPQRDGDPTTKPKACNYGLQYARGKYCVIYDAEDRPDPDQLKKAVLSFAKLPEEIICIQAKLNYFNQEQNLITRWFSIEYSMHFDLVLPGLAMAEVPIPLGGTSNHFITEKLLELGAWDPYNVTEDADLGIRLSKHGYRTTVMESTTLEEANSRFKSWINQRSRWIKGYIQTWLVHMRHPLSLISDVGFRNFMAFNLIVGGAFVFLLNPIFWALTTLYFIFQPQWIQDLFPSVVFYVAAFMLFFGNFLFVFLNVAGTLQRGYYHLTIYALFTPIYWGMMSLAAWKGFLQLFYKPFHWEKTEHGHATIAPSTTPPPKEKKQQPKEEVEQS